MLGSDYTLRSGHLLLLMLAASSIILGFGYLNEMYQRIQLQADVSILQRQTHHSVDERTVLQQRAAQIQLQLEGKDKDQKRLQEIYEFRSQQQSDNFEREKEELEDAITLKDDAIADLKDQYENLKSRYDGIHSVLEQLERNQSKLLEKFSTQSTQCMNVINMLSQLCRKGKLEKLLPLVKEKDMLVNAETKQAFSKTNRSEKVSPEQIPEESLTSTQKPGAMQNTTKRTHSQSDGTEKDLTAKLSENIFKPKSKITTGQGNASYRGETPEVSEKESHENDTAEKNMTSPTEDTLSSLLDDLAVDIQNYDDILSKDDFNEKSQLNISKPQNLSSELIKEKQVPYLNMTLDLNKSNHSKVANGTYSMHNDEGNAQKNESAKMTDVNNTAISKELIAPTQEDVKERKLNVILSEDKPLETSARKEVTQKTKDDKKKAGAQGSQKEVYSPRRKDKDRETEEHNEEHEASMPKTDKKNEKVSVLENLSDF
ncbi:DNA ligase 1-like [Hyperolius riggenbachi]|uniref:DNA ligase 1-like n=1 Tax=Hyperolius riggenbachi TaxID=752182 RepID=UPI0035A2D1CB